MKKIFTLIAVAAMAISANAQTWNFSDWEAKDYEENFTKDGMTIAASSDKKVTIDGNSKTFGDYSYTQRLKFGGAGNAESGRYLSFAVPAGANVTVHFAHASSSGDARNMVLALGDFASEVTRKEVAAGSTETLTYTNSGSASTAYLYSASSGLNVYGVIVSTAAGISQMVFGQAENGAAYNLAGQKVADGFKGVVIKNGKKMIQK